MCVVSAVIDQGYKIWPDPFIPTWPGIYPTPTTAPNNNPLDILKDWSKMLELGKKIDTATDQKDCEDPEKVIWVEKFCNRLTEIGAALIKIGNEEFGVEIIQLVANIRHTLDS